MVLVLDIPQRAPASSSEAEEDGEEADEEWVAPQMSRFTFCARRPFHPARLHRLLKRQRLEGVIRSSGIAWVATHPKESILWDQVGNSMNLRLSGDLWHAARGVPLADWPRGTPHWARNAAHGDRRVEIGLVGMDADHAAVRRALRRALVTRAEFERGLWGQDEDLRQERRYWLLMGASAMASTGAPS